MSSVFGFVSEDNFDFMIDALLEEAKETFTHCVNCDSKKIKIYYDYNMDIEEWIEHPTYFCSVCDNTKMT